MANVYVSSTFSDLETCRARVRETLQRRGHKDIAMELYGAQDKRPLDKCLEDVENCDLYIGIFTWRYGFIPDGQTKSITDLEYNKAVEKGKSHLLFLLAKTRRGPEVVWKW